MTFGSLFSGIGGLDLGLERAGLTCAWQVEIEPFCVKVLAKHWPNVKRWNDVREVGRKELERVDVVCGGFPCQDLSVAGKRAGITGKRSGLWSEFARIIGELRPRYVCIENVPGILGNTAGRRVLGDLSALGYDAEWESVRASDFGAPHRRERIFIVGRRSVGNAGVEHRSRNSGFAPQPDRDRKKNGIPGETGGSVADSIPSERRENIECLELPGRWQQEAGGPGSAGVDVVDASWDVRAGSDGEDGPGRGVRETGEDGNGDARVADSSGGLVPQPGRRPEGRDGAGSAGEVLGDSERELLYGSGNAGAGWRIESTIAGRCVADSRQPGLEIGPSECRDVGEECSAVERDCGDSIPPYPPGPADVDGWRRVLAVRPDLAPALAVGAKFGRGVFDDSSGSGNQDETPRSGTGVGRSEAPAQSPVRGVDDGIPGWVERAMTDRTKRLRALGNAVVVDCGEWAGRWIMRMERGE